MIEYRMRIADEDRTDADACYRVIDSVARILSSQASYDEDEQEFRAEALLNTTFRVSKDGGVWVHSFLDRPAVAGYMYRTAPRRDWEIREGVSTEEKAASADPLREIAQRAEED